MRYDIWKKDDFFPGPDGQRIEMDADVVEIKYDPVPLAWGYNLDEMAIGRVSDIRVEDGNLTGEVWWSEKQTYLDDEFMKTIDRDFRFGGFFSDIVKVTAADGSYSRVIKATLRSVSIVLYAANPGASLEDHDAVQ